MHPTYKMPVYTGPDPNTTTRQAFTDYFLSQECPTNAVPKYRHVFDTHQKLMKLLIDHPAMDQNRGQTYMTPAASKNKIYFMWDFIGRTLGMLAGVDPVRPRGGPWADILSRCTLSKMLILDTTGKLNAMNRSVGYNDDEGIEFTEEIKNEAQNLGNVPQ
jgi:hypothetical protein